MGSIIKLINSVSFISHNEMLLLKSLNLKLKGEKNMKIQKAITYNWLCFLAVLVIFSQTDVVFAKTDKPSPPVVNLQAEAQAEIANDLMKVRLRAIEKGKNAAKLADIVNFRMNKAIKEAKKLKGVQIKTTGYHTSQWWEKGKQKGWTVSQEVELKGKDMKALTELLGKVQAYVHVIGMSFEPSREKVEELQNKLIAQALAKFRTRADLAATGLGFSKWTPQTISISTSGRSPRPIPIYRAKMMAETAEPITAPEVAPGVNMVKANVSGSVLLSK